MSENRTIFCNIVVDVYDKSFPRAWNNDIRPPLSHERPHPDIRAARKIPRVGEGKGDFG
jgi:hypothetical protein